MAPERLLSLHQVHSAEVVVAGPEGWVERPRADAAVTAGAGRGARRADRRLRAGAPRRRRGRGGRRGACRLARRARRRARGDGRGDGAARAPERGRIRAAVGPTISQRAYEVGPEFFDRFRDEEAGYERFFAPGAGDRLRFDLPGFVLARLREAGVGEAGWIGACTLSEPDRFFSYRRATQAGEADYGRLISAIRV